MIHRAVGKKAQAGSKELSAEMLYTGSMSCVTPPPSIPCDGKIDWAEVNLYWSNNPSVEREI